MNKIKLQEVFTKEVFSKQIKEKVAFRFENPEFVEGTRYEDDYFVRDTKVELTLNDDNTVHFMKYDRSWSIRVKKFNITEKDITVEEAVDYLIENFDNRDANYSEIVTIMKQAMADEEVEVSLFYNQYKGTGKAWIANTDNTRKILSFVDCFNHIKDGYKGERVFKLTDGLYIFNEEGSKSKDNRSFVEVKDGQVNYL